MIEAIAAFLVYRFLADRAASKGRARSWGLLGVCLFFAGEVLGAALGLTLWGRTPTAYLIALAVGVCGAAIGTFAVSRLRRGQRRTGTSSFRRSYSDEELASAAAAVMGTTGPATPATHDGNAPNWADEAEGPASA